MRPRGEGHDPVRSALERQPCRDVSARRAMRVLACALVSAWVSACVGSTCEREGQRPQRYSGGNTNASGTVYESSGLDGPYLFFPGGKTYQLEHGLRERPVEYHVLLSFAEFPFESTAGVAENAGNQAVVQDINEDFIELRNDTCAEFFVRLTARTGEFEEGASGDPRLGDAAADPDAGGAVTGSGAALDAAAQ